MFFSKELGPLLLVENILGVNRNWCYHKQDYWRKYIVPAFWVTCSVVLNLQLKYFIIYYAYEINENAVRFLICLSTSNGIVTIVFAWLTSGKFYKLLSCLTKIHLLLLHYPKYSSNTGCGWKVAILLVSYTVCIIFFMTSSRINYNALDVSSVLVFIWMAVVVFSTYIRNGTEYLMFHCILTILSTHSKLIANRIRGIGQKLQHTRNNGNEPALKLNEVFGAYTYLFESCELINGIFSVPVIVKDTYS